jgi:hypothetical protein
MLKRGDRLQAGAGHGFGELLAGEWNGGDRAISALSEYLHCFVLCSVFYIKREYKVKQAKISGFTGFLKALAGFLNFWNCLVPSRDVN